MRADDLPPPPTSHPPPHTHTHHNHNHNSALALALGIEAHTTDSRNACRLDFVSNTLSFARDAGFTPAQTMAGGLTLVHFSAQPQLNFSSTSAYPQLILSSASH